MTRLIKKAGTWVLDTMFGGVAYPWGWAKPHVVRGYFGVERHHQLQQLFFNELMASGFTRTYWQLIFPGQTAGIIKVIEPAYRGAANQYHIKFYDDGTIEGEFEVQTFSLKHWSGPRDRHVSILEDLISPMQLDETTKQDIRALFGNKEFTYECIRPQGVIWEIEE